MSQEEEKVEVVKRKRGRPKKTPDAPVVNEKTTVLEMSHESNPSVKKDQKTTLQSVESNLHSLYTKIYSISGMPTDPSADIFNLWSDNPFIQNSRLKRLNTSPGALTRESLTKSLSNPGNNEIPLRSVDWAQSAK